MSIFDDKNKVKNNWFKALKVGDKIEGTLVSVKTINNQLSGGEQKIYELLLEDGTYMNVGGKPGIDFQMQHVRLGQIVGFEFVKETPPKKPGLSPTKIIQVYADKNTVNEKWLAEYETAQALVRGTVDGEEENTGVVVNFEETSTEKAIMALAKQKIAGSDDQNYRIKVMETTGLAYIESNYETIIEKLKTL